MGKRIQGTEIAPDIRAFSHGLMDRIKTMFYPEFCDYSQVPLEEVVGRRIQVLDRISGSGIDLILIRASTLLVMALKTQAVPPERHHR